MQIIKIRKYQVYFKYAEYWKTAFICVCIDDENHVESLEVRIMPDKKYEEKIHSTIRDIDMKVILH